MLFDGEKAETLVKERKRLYQLGFVIFRSRTSFIPAFLSSVIWLDKIPKLFYPIDWKKMGNREDEKVGREKGYIHRRQMFFF